MHVLSYHSEQDICDRLSLQRRFDGKVAHDSFNMSRSTFSLTIDREERESYMVVFERDMQSF